MFFPELYKNVPLGSEPPSFWRPGTSLPGRSWNAKKSKIFIDRDNVGIYYVCGFHWPAKSAAWIKYFIVLSGAMGTFYIISQPNLKK